MAGGSATSTSSTKGYDYGEFLNGDYHLEYPIDINLMWDMLPIAKRTSSLEGYQVEQARVCHQRLFGI